MSESLSLVRLVLLLLLLMHQLVPRHIWHADSPRTIVHLQRGRYSPGWPGLVEQRSNSRVSIGRRRR